MPGIAASDIAGASLATRRPDPPCRYFSSMSGLSCWRLLHCHCSLQSRQTRTRKKRFPGEGKAGEEQGRKKTLQKRRHLAPRVCVLGNVFWLTSSPFTPSARPSFRPCCLFATTPNNDHEAGNHGRHRQAGHAITATEGSQCRKIFATTYRFHHIGTAAVPEISYRHSPLSSFERLPLIHEYAMML